MGCGKKGSFSPFHDPFTTHSQCRGNPNPRIPTGLFQVFHNFPTPYYGYYNKFNKIDRSGDCIPTQNSIRTRKTKERIQFEHRM